MQALYRQFDRQEELDRQYNPSLAVSDPHAELRRYVEHSDQARRSISGALDVRYGPTVDEHLDIFPAAAPGPPVFLFIHGGYWRSLSSKDFTCVARGPHSLGLTTVVINYALCPWVSVDEIVRQCRAAIAWVVRHIKEFGGDPARIAIGGHSAGAHLCAMCLATNWEERYRLPAEPVVAALLASGLYDLAPLRYTYLQPQIQLSEGSVARNSPLHRVRPCAADAFITWGERESEEFRRQSEAFHAVWRAVGNKACLAPVPDADHFSVIHGLERPESDVCRWLECVLKGGEASARAFVKGASHAS